MRCYAYILLIGLTACSGAKQEKSSKKEATTEQPTEVSGGFGLTMQCSVLNREVEGATSSEIGCVVSNDDGTKYTGSMKNLKASITGKGQTSAIQATPILTDASSSISVGVNVPGLKPGDALSIAINGLFDEKPATLSSTLKGRFAVICDVDMELYVQVNSPTSNLACTREAPCAKISQAVSLLPDVFNCKVNVYLAPSKEGQKTFYDQIIIHGKEVTIKGGLRFIGTDSEFGDRIGISGQKITVPTLDNIMASSGPLPRQTAPTIVIEPPENLASVNSLYPDDPYSPYRAIDEKRAAIQVRSFGLRNAILSLENIEINGKSPYSSYGSFRAPGYFENGISLETSPVNINNVNFDNLGGTAIKIGGSSFAQLTDIKVSHSETGIYVKDSESKFAGTIEISRDPTAPVKTDDAIEGILSNSPSEKEKMTLKTVIGVSFENAVIRFKNGLDFSVINVLQGISLYRSSNITLANPVWVTLDSNDYGIASNNSSFTWITDLGAALVCEPSIRITNCKETCIQLTDNSYFTIQATKEKQQTLQLSTSNLTANLISAYKNSTVTIDRVQNDWCDASPNTFRVVQDSTFYYFRRDKNTANKAFKSSCGHPNRKFQSYAHVIPAIDHRCDLGWLLNGDLCYAQVGYGFTITDTPSSLTSAIPNDLDISDW